MVINVPDGQTKREIYDKGRRDIGEIEAEEGQSERAKRDKEDKVRLVIYKE